MVISKLESQFIYCFSLMRKFSFTSYLVYIPIAVQRNNWSSMDEDIYFQNKLNQLNTNLNSPEVRAASAKFGNIGVWTLSDLKSAFAQAGLTAQSHYDLYGKKEGVSPYKIGYADGGIATGPKSGYWELLHGTEAVIPMGRGSLPITFQGGVNMEPLIQEIRLLRYAVESREESDDKRHFETHRALKTIRDKVIIFDTVGMPERKVS